MLIDTHCHVHFNAFKDDMDDVVLSALSKGVQMITIGTQHETSANAVKLAERYEGVWAAVGLHPSHLFEGYTDIQEHLEKHPETSFDLEYYRGLLRHPKTVAVGEIGLDYYHEVQGVGIEEMKRREADMFEVVARLAITEVMPVIIHCRDAHDDQIALIEKLWGPYTTGEPPRGVIHCFTGTWHDAERYLALGFYLGFTGVITFPPKKADIAAGKETLADIVKKVPLDRLLVETDSPYLAPIPMRGKRNMPEYLEFVARKVAELKGLSFEEVADATTANARRLFKKMEMV